MVQVGQFALALAFAVTAYSIIASLVGIRLKNDKLIDSGKRAAPDVRCDFAGFLFVQVFHRPDRQLESGADHRCS